VDKIINYDLIFSSDKINYKKIYIIYLKINYINSDNNLKTKKVGE
jgi:hypothetical protein